MSTNNYKKDAWKITPYLRQEGIFEGTVVRIRRMVSAEGCMILVRMDDALTATMTEELESAEQNYLQSKLPENLRNYIYREVIDAKGSVKIGVFFYGWPESDSDNETEIESLLLHTRPGHRIRFRMSKNWRRDRFYCRYINNLDNDEWSGYEDEADWRQAYHPYPSLPLSGFVNLELCHAEHIYGDYGFAYSIEAIPSGYDSTYRLLAPCGTQAYRILRCLRSTGADTEHLNLMCKTSVDKETGKSYLSEIKTDILNIRHRPSGPVNNYADVKATAEKNYIKLLSDEFESTRGQYRGTVINDDGINFNRPSSFVPIRLEDGRLIMPEIRSRATKGSYAASANIEILRPGQTDLMKNKKYFFPGLKVNLYFSPGRKGNHMILRAVTCDTAEEELKNQKANWLAENSEKDFLRTEK